MQELFHPVARLCLSRRESKGLRARAWANSATFLLRAFGNTGTSDDTGLDYEPNAKVVGRGNVVVPVGFLIKARRVGQSIYDKVHYHI